VFEYFSSIKREDGSTFMKPSDLLAALVAVYPPDAGPAGPVRSGSLPGERAPRPAKDRHKPVRLPCCLVLALTPTPNPEPHPYPIPCCKHFDTHSSEHDTAWVAARSRVRNWAGACWYSGSVLPTAAWV